MERSQKVHNHIVRLLTAAKSFPGGHLWDAWLRTIAGALFLENKYLQEFEAIDPMCKKEILDSMDGFESVDIQNARDLNSWCCKTYDSHHRMRFSVWTIDSIESVRVYLKKNDGRHLGNLVSLKYKKVVKENYE